MQTTYQYLHGLKEAQKGTRRIIDELNSLNCVLLYLYDLVNNSENTESRLSNIGRLLHSSDGPLHQCQVELQALHSKLSQPSTGLKDLGKTLMWPLKEKETQRALDIIRAQKVTCGLALNVENA